MGGVGVRSGKPVRHPGVAWREIEGEVVIISPGSSEVHELNGTGSYIWGRLDGERTAEEIAGLVAEEFEVEEGKALADTAAFVAELEGKGLVLAGGSDE